MDKSKEWINYDIPSETLATLPWGKIYIGQTQKWKRNLFQVQDRERYFRKMGCYL